ncbi:hypothetical protein EDB86DRAFT_3074111 [Lactarius hatsudake]|nr:hypothetical protein EDB86DRAFT_3074111 [Lactarius hatsudake]
MHLEPIRPQLRSALPPLKNFARDIVIAYYRSFAGMVGISLSHFSEVGYRASSMVYVRGSYLNAFMFQALQLEASAPPHQSEHIISELDFPPFTPYVKTSRPTQRTSRLGFWKTSGGYAPTMMRNPQTRHAVRRAVAFPSQRARPLTPPTGFSPGIALHERTAEAVGPGNGLHRPAHAHPARGARSAHPLAQTEGVRVSREQRAKRLVLDSGWITEGLEKQRNVMERYSTLSTRCCSVETRTGSSAGYEQERVALKERPKRETRGKGRRSILSPPRPILNSRGRALCTIRGLEVPQTLVEEDGDGEYDKDDDASCRLFSFTFSGSPDRAESSTRIAFTSGQFPYTLEAS